MSDYEKTSEEWRLIEEENLKYEKIQMADDIRKKFGIKKIKKEKKEIKVFDSLEPDPYMSM